MSDKNKGAVPKSSTDPAFERSTIVNRTPPGAQWETEQRDDSVYLCQICMVTDEVHKIRCDACTLWYHFVCAHVPNDAVDKEVWLCPECVKNRRSARIQPTNPVNAGSENQADTVQMSQLVDVGENPAVTVAESNTILRLENPAGQLTLRPPQVRKSNSTSSTMSRRTTLALQRLEEERRLNEQRDYEAREYLKKKYDILEDDVASNVSYDDEEISRYRLESIRQWTENVQESPLEADRITTTDVAQLHSTATVTQSGNDNMTSGAEAVDHVNVNVIQGYEEATTSANYQVEPLPDWLTNPRTVSQKPYPWSRSTQETSDLIVTSGQPISLSELSVAKMKTSVQPHPHPWFSSLKSGPTNSTSQNLRPNGRSNAFIEPVTNVTSSMDHVFVDAGLEACAANVYYRIEDDEGVDCCLIGAKTKVAPNKPLSVPRLELQAAILGIRLVDNISKCQKIQVDERFFWSDSQTVLGWINSEARKFHQYVAFRIGEILENSSVDEWNWVDSKNNVADDATKSENLPDTSSTSRWYKAPSFLYQPRETWNFGKGKTKFSTEEEVRSVYLLAHVEMPNYALINVNSFSNWNRLVRAMAYALRFIDNVRKRKQNRQFGPFTRDEYVRSRNTLFRQAQREEFLEEILTISNNESLPVDKRKEIHRSSVLRNCSPYLDQDGLLRIKGRIDAARSVPYSTKRPIILPRNSYITKLLVCWHHRKLHHVNHQATLNQIKQTFYIPALRVVLKGVIQNLCQRCKNDKSNPIIPDMAELPPERLSTFTHPFTFVGVDYFGPLKVKVRRSTEKRWGVIFTCLTTRAVYIEIAHSYDTSSCIFCIRNFANRNGQPSKYFSDNGTHFRGAESELREEFQKMNKTKMEETFTDEHTQWIFNPPTAAHMGGVWERPIRTIKSVLKKVMPTRLPTDEMLRSYLVEIENIVNSIPLTYVQLDNVDDDVLTPNHFLKGSANGMKSPGRFDPKNLCRDDWKAVQEMTNQFWRQFVVEYISTLTRRTKWFSKVNQLKIGDIVIDCDESSERNEWRKGIIEEVAIGKGNQVRRAKVRMIRGGKTKIAGLEVEDIKHQSLWRPVAKLAALDVKDNRLSSSPEAVNREGNVTNES